MMKKLGKISCLQATSLVEKKASLGLSFAESLKLLAHTTICDGCRMYQKQSKWLDQVLVRRGAVTSIPQDKAVLKLSEDVKVKIISSLENKQ